MRTLPARPWRLVALLLALLLLLPGCANLDAVREFGKTAAELTSFAEAGKAYQDSARTIQPYLAGAPSAAESPARRDAQVRGAMTVQASLSAYFATLAKLAGADAFTLDKEIDAIDKGLQSLPAGAVDPATAQAAAGLAKTLQKYALLPAQEAAVKDLVHEGGPPAMRILERLEVVTASWKGIVANDRALTLGALEPLAQARDTPPLLAILGRERQVELDHTYAVSLERMTAAEAALARIRAAHAAMAANIDHLRGKQLRGVLKQAVADLKGVRKNLLALD